MNLHNVWKAIAGIMSSWHEGKLFIEHAIAIDHDALHVIVGVLVWLAFAFVSRRSITSWRPWLWLLALILWNETVDLWTEQWPSPGMQYGEGAKDVALTMLLPALLMLVARVRPQLFRGTAPGRKRGR